MSSGTCYIGRRWPNHQKHCNLPVPWPRTRRELRLFEQVVIVVYHFSPLTLLSREPCTTIITTSMRTPRFTPSLSVHIYFLHWGSFIRLKVRNKPLFRQTAITFCPWSPRLQSYSLHAPPLQTMPIFKAVQSSKPNSWLQERTESWLESTEFHLIGPVVLKNAKIIQ